jgi:hypothetical protein
MIEHSAATLDYLAFSTSALKHKLERNRFLGPKLCLFGDNAYVNTSYMAKTYKGANGGTKDNYHFYQSQVRTLFWKNKSLLLVSHSFKLLHRFRSTSNAHLECLFIVGVCFASLSLPTLA